MTQVRSRRLHPFEKELIASIENERRTFNMKEYTKDHQVAKCGTAMCMAGHIEALRRPLALRLAKQPKYSYGGSPSVDHPAVAAEIYRRETGKDCLLDFFAQPYDDIEAVTRDEAIAHIKGTNAEWPLLTEEDADYRPLSAYDVGDE